jgi:hypothetical protein
LKNGARHGHEHDDAESGDGDGAQGCSDRVVECGAGQLPQVVAVLGTRARAAYEATVLEPCTIANSTSSSSTNSRCDDA